jgi:hypothetical protein
MKYEHTTRKISELTPHPKNPRRHPEDMLKKLGDSIKEFGFTNPVLISEDNTILAGHARTTAAERLGFEEVPCIVLSLSGKSADAYVIADNKINELSEWNDELLVELFKSLDDEGFNAELTGFSADEIERLISPKQSVEDDFDVEKAEKEVENNGIITQSGDIWELGNHRLICGSGTQPENFSRLLSERTAKLCIADLNEKDTDTWRAKTPAIIQNICAFSETACAIISDNANSDGQFIEPRFAGSTEMFANWNFRPIWTRIWDKGLKFATRNSYTSAKPINEAEYITAFAKTSDINSEQDETETAFISAFARHGYKFVKRLSLDERKSWGYSQLWRIEGKKPVELPFRLIKMHSDKYDIILDPNAENFTTGIACEQLGRRCFAVVKEPKNADVSVARYLAFTEDENSVFLHRNGDTFSINDLRERGHKI